MQVMASEYAESLRANLPKELRSIPKPFFISTLFEDEPVAICRPLMDPFGNFAITHFGTVFRFRPSRITTTPFGNTIRQEDICIPKFRPNDERPIVTLSSPLMQRRFFIHRLVLDRFYGVSINEKVIVEFLDGDQTNAHILNLEAIFKNSPYQRRVPEYQNDRHEWCPVH